MQEKEQEECFLYTARMNTGPLLINYSDWYWQWQFLWKLLQKRIKATCFSLPRLDEFQPAEKKTLISLQDPSYTMLLIILLQFPFHVLH